MILQADHDLNNLLNQFYQPRLIAEKGEGGKGKGMDGIAGKEPAFGLEALWIEPQLKQRAETMNYTVVDATSVVATHLTEVIKGHAHEILTREDVSTSDGYAAGHFAHGVVSSRRLRRHPSGT